MNDIDTMDMLGFMEMKAWKAQRDYRKKYTPKPTYIDQVWPGMTATL